MTHFKVNEDYNTQLQQYLPLAVLKRENMGTTDKVGLQQYLPLAVLKRIAHVIVHVSNDKLQQYLPLAVLKLVNKVFKSFIILYGCNSTYRLRY